MKNSNTFAVLVLLLLGAGLTATAQTEIRTAEELAAIGQDGNSLKGSYILTDDLTLDDWTPIGGLDDRDGQGFSGTFDGNGHTITIAGFCNSCDNTRIGLFGLIEKEGVVKKLCVTGNVRYTGSRKILYIGGIVGVNHGLVTCCVSKIVLEGTIKIAKEKPSKKVKSLSGYEDGAYGGCIAGINQGTITNCYATGSVLISGEQIAEFAGGIVGGNGEPVGGSIGISIGSGGGGVSVNQGVTKLRGAISHCYSTASVFSQTDVASVVSGITKARTVSRSGGIAAFNHPTGLINSCVSLNETIETSGKGGSQSATPVASIGLTYYRNPDAYYRSDIAIHKYQDGKEQKPDKFSEKNAVAFSATQEQSWWRLPEGLTPKQQQQRFGFAFGEDEQSPWVWNDEGKCPVLYWEKFEVALTPLIKNEPETETEETRFEAKEATEGQLTHDISWKIENGTLTVSGIGDMPGAPSSLNVGALSDGTSVIIEDGITSLGHHAFASSKISSIILGENVASLKTCAFSSCKNLVLVEVKSAKPPKVGTFAFTLTPIGKAKLIVPAGAKAAYASDKSWKKFGTIEER